MTGIPRRGKIGNALNQRIRESDSLKEKKDSRDLSPDI